MMSLKKIIANFGEWFKLKYKFVYINELPEKASEKTIYIVGDSKQPWLLAFNCPCGCQSLIQLSLLKDSNPRWKYYINKKNKISISPSIWRNTGCKSHFFVRNNKIDWVKDYKS